MQHGMPQQPYMPRRGQCKNAIFSGALMGGGTGLVMGLMIGVFGVMGQGYTRREALRHIGKTSAASAGSFSVFMGVGQAIRSGKCF